MTRHFHRDMRDTCIAQHRELGLNLNRIRRGHAGFPPQRLAVYAQGSDGGPRHAQQTVSLLQQIADRTFTVGTRHADHAHRLTGVAVKLCGHRG